MVFRSGQNIQYFKIHVYWKVNLNVKLEAQESLNPSPCITVSFLSKDMSKRSKTDKKFEKVSEEKKMDDDDRRRRRTPSDGNKLTWPSAR